MANGKKAVGQSQAPPKPAPSSLCDQTIPADTAPGARAAGVLFFIDRQLAGPLRRFAPSLTVLLRLRPA